MLFLASGTAATVTDFKTGVYEAISDSDFQKADSLLDVWRISAPQSQELYPAEFNRYLNEARQSMITLEGPEGEGYSVYTIEKSLGDVWVLGASKDGNHSNYGAVDRPDDAAAFVGILKKKGLVAVK